MSASAVHIRHGFDIVVNSGDFVFSFSMIDLANSKKSTDIASVKGWISDLHA